MTEPQDDRAVAQPLHPHQPGADRRHRGRAARRLCSGRATLFVEGGSISSASRSRSPASSSASAGPKWLRAALADAARPVKRFYKTVEPSRADNRDPARRPAGEDARPRTTSPPPTAGAGRGDRRRMERAGREDRPARDAADRPRQCRDRPDRARPRGLRRAASPLMARATCSATAPRGRRRWSRGRPSAGIRSSPGRGGATTSISRSPPASSTGRSRPRRSSGCAAAVAARDAVRARRPVAAGDDLRLAGRRARARRRRDRPRRRPGRRRRSTSSGRPSNGARTPRRPPRSPRAARDFEAAARFLGLL